MKKPKNAYDFICPKCEADQYLVPSMAMEMGMNLGHGSCLKCKTFLHLELDDLGKQTAKAEIWDDYVQRMKTEQQEICKK